MRGLSCQHRPHQQRYHRHQRVTTFHLHCPILFFILPPLPLLPPYPPRIIYPRPLPPIPPTQSTSTSTSGHHHGTPTLHSRTIYLYDALHSSTDPTHSFISTRHLRLRLHHYRRHDHSQSSSPMRKQQYSPSPIRHPYLSPYHRHSSILHHPHCSVANGLNQYWTEAVPTRLTKSLVSRHLPNRYLLSYHELAIGDGAVSAYSYFIIWRPAVGDHALTFLTTNHSTQSTWRPTEYTTTQVREATQGTARCFSDWNEFCEWGSSCMQAYTDPRNRRQRLRDREPFPQQTSTFSSQPCESNTGDCCLSPTSSSQSSVS